MGYYDDYYEEPYDGYEEPHRTSKPCGRGMHRK